MSEPSRTKPLEIAVLRDPRRLLALGFGSGLAPLAPGTVGTLAAVVPYLWLRDLEPWAYAGFLLLAFALGVWICEHTGRYLGDVDHPGMVWDEFVGFWLAMFAAPPGWAWIVLGFCLFRLFDIGKPWPANVVNRDVQSGLGVMLDDVIAGLYALLLLQAGAWMMQEMRGL